MVVLDEEWLKLGILRHLRDTVEYLLCIRLIGWAMATMVLAKER